MGEATPHTGETAGAAACDPADEPTCSIERSLRVLGERWTLLILRDVFRGMHRFSELRASLGIAPNLLSARLKALTEGGLLRQETYVEPGSRPRESYHLTAAGHDLRLLLGSLQQWGDTHRPRPAGPSVERRSSTTGRPVRVAFLDDTGTEVPPEDVRFLPR